MIFFCDVDDSNYFMMDDDVNNNIFANVANIVHINDNDNNNNSSLPVAPQEMKHILCDNPKAEAPGKGKMVGNIVKGLQQ